MAVLGEKQLGPDVFADAARRLSNWDRWGADDQVGTLNLITSERRAAAARSVRTGVTVPLSLPLDATGPSAPPRGAPLHFMTATGTDSPLKLTGGASFTDDYIVMALQCSTQWDGLAHVYYDGHMWNGVPAAEVTAAGAARNGI